MSARKRKPAHKGKPARVRKPAKLPPMSNVEIADFTKAILEKVGRASGVADTARQCCGHCEGRNAEGALAVLEVVLNGHVADLRQIAEWVEALHNDAAARKAVQS